MKQLIISAPFGNYLSWKGTSRILGTFTSARRAGFFGRIWRTLRTVRYWRKAKAWVNKLGLPNPGITSLKRKKAEGHIISIHGTDFADWRSLVASAVVLAPEAIEMNVSCPNIYGSARDYVTACLSSCRLARSLGVPVIAKLPPVRWNDYVVALYEAGVRIFHCCNTIPCPAGGMSGKPLKAYSLWAIDDLRNQYGKEITLIGGGGVTELQDVKDYISAGADHVTVASMLFNPLNWLKIPYFVEWLERRA